MVAQTIALFRFQLIGIVSRRLMVSLLMLLLMAFLGGRFVAGLALVNGEAVALAAQADFLRYCLVLLLVVALVAQVARDYDSGQLERILAMPLARWQYLLSLLGVLSLLSLLLATAALLPLLPFEPDKALYWGAAVFLELLLAGQMALLAILSLERLPQAIPLALGLYLLARLGPVIDLALKHSADFYQDETGFRFGQQLFMLIRYLLPGDQAFASNNLLLTEGAALLPALGQQLIQVLIYLLFLQAVVMADFYRKELGR
jgi:hypothetical protein